MNTARRARSKKQTPRISGGLAYGISDTSKACHFHNQGSLRR